MPETNEKKPDKAPAIAGAYKKGVAKEPVPDKPVVEDQRIKDYMAIINILPQVFVHNATVLVGDKETDLFVLEDMMGTPRSVLVMPKGLSARIAGQINSMGK